MCGAKVQDYFIFIYYIYTCIYNICDYLGKKSLLFSHLTAILSEQADDEVG